MSTYVIGDVHGCFDALQQMLKTIDFSDGDRLLLTGDYIDRGSQSREMLDWLEQRPANVIPVRGNHDEEFARYIDLIRLVDQREALETDPESHDDVTALYAATKYFIRKNGLGASMHFDLYGTLLDMLRDPSATLAQVTVWADMLRKLPYFVSFHAGGRDCVVVHAGYRHDGFLDETEAAEFYLYAREEAIRDGGIERGMIIAGHTPTVVRRAFAWNDGKVYRHYDAAKDCIFYDIDCGCAFRQKYPNARLACLRVEDEAVFYV